MDIKSFLEGFNGKRSVNTSSGLNVSLRGNRKLLPLNDIGEVISEFDQYNDERRACNKIRLTCQVNPVCSNVLFNRITEIVRDEGSDDVKFINYSTPLDKDEELFKNVVYKPRLMSYWAGGTMNYQQFDSNLLSKSIESNVEDSDRRPIQPQDLVPTQREIPGHPTNAIRDTQLTRVDEETGDHFVYHCGLDIFNNHLIRSNSFKCICKLSDDTQYENPDTDYTAFNTIADIMRDVNGDKVIEKLCFPTTSGIDGYTKFLALHVYLYDNILTFDQSIKERLIKKYNGWLGFDNKSKLKTYENFKESEDLKIERPIMYMQGGDFVDMYPGRDLYSFVPKFNHFRQRIEKNWNYCITYPSSSTTLGFDDIFERNGGINSLKTIYFDETRRSDNGTKQLVMYSKSKHGLAQGDYVNIYKTVEDENGNVTTTKILDNAEVDVIVDDFIFTVFNQGVEISRKWVQLTDEEKKSETITVDGETYRLSMNTRKYYQDGEYNKYYIINDSYVNFDKNAQRISYKKVVNDIECDYYVRILSRLPNFKNSSGDTSNEYEVYRKRKESGDKNMIEVYQQPEYEFESHVSRLAFAKNIYTDEVGEIVFTDDIDLSYLKDNLGRPLSELFLTIVKNNRGYKEWYGYDETGIDINSENVEYSHCFGRITCGLEMADEAIYDEEARNIKNITNIDCTSPGFDNIKINPDRKDKRPNETVIQEEIVFDSDINYYGDVCYYDNYNAIERSIQPILHRFNTAQRESSISASKNIFRKFLYDEIGKDDYDTDNEFIIDSKGFSSDCNNKKEGYYYIPHYQIPIKSYDILQSVLPQFLTIRSIINNGDATTITTLENHYLSPGDKSMIYDKENNKYYYCNTVRGTNDSPRVYTCKICDENGNPTTDIDGDKIATYNLFKIDNLGIPSYARILKDGTCRFIWRDLLNNGFNTADDTLEEYPFTNGAFYINKRIDLFLRRQDPHNEYGLYADDDIEGINRPIETENNYSKEEDIEC